MSSCIWLVLLNIVSVTFDLCWSSSNFFLFIAVQNLIVLNTSLSICPLYCQMTNLNLGKEIVFEKIVAIGRML